LIAAWAAAINAASELEEAAALLETAAEEALLEAAALEEAAVLEVACEEAAVEEAALLVAVGPQADKPTKRVRAKPVVMRNRFAIIILLSFIYAIN
jgi:hypothetical protein